MNSSDFPKCENEECSQKDTCCHYLSESNVVINYPLISDKRDKCTWYGRDKSVEVEDE